MRAVKNKDKGVPVSGKNQPIVESVPTFHVFPKTPQANSRVEVGLTIDMASPNTVHLKEGAEMTGRWSWT